MADPTPTQPGGCLWTLIATMLSGFLLFFTSAPSATPVLEETATLQIILAPQTATDDLNAVVEGLQRRLTSLGIDSATVEVVDGKLVVEVRTEIDTNELIEALTQPGVLELVDFSGLSFNQIETLMLIQTTGRENEAGELNPVTGEPFETILTGDLIRFASLGTDNQSNWSVEIAFTPEGSEIVAAFTASHIGEPLAIVLDGRLLSAPIIQSEIRDRAVITGVFTEAEAGRIAALIDAGALPVPLIFESIDVIDGTK